MFLVEINVTVPHISELQRLLPKYSIREAMVRNYRWYLANRDTISKATGVTHRVPWKQMALNVVKIFF
jgi:hypothetical protein